MLNMKYIYPRLGIFEFGFVRIGGPGLANCMLLAIRAYQYSKELGVRFVNPCWFKVSIGPYLRREKDKRHYFGLFNPYGVSGISRFLLINKCVFRESQLSDFIKSEKGILYVEGLGQYFEGLNPKIAVEYVNRITKNRIKQRVNLCDFSNTIAIHVRLGDYGTSSPWSTPIKWYASLIDQMKEVNPQLNFAIFSDGSDEQLKDLMIRERVKKVFLGNALADILAMGRCKVVIASNSTFSALGAFIGHKPVIFRERLFGPVYADKSQLEYVLGDNPILPTSIKNML